MIKTIIEGTDYQLQPGADTEDIKQIGEIFEVTLLEAYTTLLEETNGILRPDGKPLIWPTKKVMNDNLYFRNDSTLEEFFESFDDILFFGDNGKGQRYGFFINNGVCLKDCVVTWTQAGDKRDRRQVSLEDLITGLVKE